MERMVIGIYNLKHLNDVLWQWLRRPTIYSSDPVRLIVGVPQPDQAQLRTYFICRSGHKDYRLVMSLQGASFKKGEKGKYYHRKQYHVTYCTYDIWYVDWRGTETPLAVQSYPTRQAANKAMKALFTTY